MDKRRDIEKLWYFDTKEDFSGSEIRLSRNVDLKAYNDYETIAKSADWIDWSDSESLEFDFLTRRLLKTFNDKFILRASEYGISRYEKILGISPDKKESLEDRRKRVYLLWNKKIIWTHRTLLEWLNIRVGKSKYRLELKYNKYELEFELFVGKEYEESGLYEELRGIVPANLGIFIKYGFVCGVDIISKYGTYNYPAFLCGEHPCGDIPHVFAEAQRLVSDLNIETGSNYGKNYYPTVGKIKSGDLENGEVTEIIYATDFNSDNIYSFERGE